ncbi:MAG: DedA family protein [Actinobacteria bacterium]|nr:MAG: DedA family protein [Actinomycetota bacterium]
MLAILNGLINLLTGSGWTYPLLFGICLGDAVFPILPSETAAIVCGIQAARGKLSLEWVLVLAALGAFAGDNTSYAGGRWLGRPVQQRLFSGETAQRRLDWAKRFLTERGSYVLIVARFIPGGRTATTFTAGLVKFSWHRRFAPYIALAAVLWAGYAVLLGYIGGRTFRNQPIYAIVLAFGIAALITVGVELLRRLRAS